MVIVVERGEIGLDHCGDRHRTCMTPDRVAGKFAAVWDSPLKLNLSIEQPYRHHATHRHQF